MKQLPLAVVPALLFLLQGSTRAQVATWPQWGGPTRDFKAPSRGLAARWPAGGPRELWSRPLGEGYSAIAAEGDALYTLYRPTGGTGRGRSASEVVVALDPATGKTRWERTYEAPPVAGMNLEYGPGPHSTPLVVRDRVYAVGVTGKLRALDRKTGRPVWSRDLWNGLGGKVQDRGYSCSPLAYRDTIVLTVGGSGQAVVAFGQEDGRVVWKNGDFDPSPSTVALISVDGQDQLVLFHANGIAGLDPGSGAALWDHPHKTDWGLNITSGAGKSSGRTGPSPAPRSFTRTVGS